MINHIENAQGRIQEWKLLDISIRNSPTLSQFKRSLIQMIRPPKRSTLGIHDAESLKLLTRLRFKFSHLRKHRFRHNIWPKLFLQQRV